MIKKLALSFLFALLFIVLVGGFLYKEEIFRLQKVLTLFEPENISENFRSFPDFINTKVVKKSPERASIPKADQAWALPNSFKLGDSIIQTKEFLDHTSTDGFLIIQNDSIRYENYGNGFAIDDIHISWSMSKSLISALYGIALSEGKIKNINQYATEYLPELRGTGYDQVTIKNLLQMSSGVLFNEDYGDFNSDINRMGRFFALGMPMADFAASLTNEKKPGTYNHYVSIDTQVLGMILVKATGESITSYTKSRLWDPMGAENDAFWIVDNAGMEFALGGLNASLRDYARLGKLFLDSGRWNGKQLVPEEWVLVSTTPQDEHVQQRIENGVEMDGYGYQWWIPYGADDEYNALGVYDQFIYIDPDKDAVIVKLSSNHYFQEDFDHLYKKLTIALFRDILN